MKLFSTDHSDEVAHSMMDRLLKELSMTEDLGYLKSGGLNITHRECKIQQKNY
jgi:hypothetical protein